MRNLTLGDLRLALRDLLDERGNELRLSATGKLYEARLRAKQKEIEAIPEPTTQGAPLATELAEKDLEHDGFGNAIFSLCEAIAAHPALSTSLKDAAANAKEKFVPQLDVLRAPYADEAASALNNQSALAQQKAALKSIATPGGGTLFDWVKRFIAAGDDIDGLLRKRAAALATTESAAASGPLRGATVGLLGRFREALLDEMGDPGSKLPAGHDTELFAYLDKLSADRERALRERSRKDAPASGGGETPAGVEAPVEPGEPASDGD